MAVPLVRDCRRLVALVAELEAPDSVGLDGRDGEPGFGVFALQGLDEGDAVEDERAGQVDRVDPAALAGAVDAGRAGAKGVGHIGKGTSSSPPLSPTLPPERGEGGLIFPAPLPDPPP